MDLQLSLVFIAKVSGIFLLARPWIDNIDWVKETSQIPILQARLNIFVTVKYRKIIHNWSIMTSHSCLRDWIKWASVFIRPTAIEWHSNLMQLVCQSSYFFASWWWQALHSVPGLVFENGKFDVRCIIIVELILHSCLHWIEVLYSWLEFDKSRWVGRTTKLGAVVP